MIKKEKRSFSPKFWGGFFKSRDAELGQQSKIKSRDAELIIG